MTAKIATTFILSILFILLLLFVAPSNIYIISGFIFLIICLIYLLSSIFLSSKDSILISIFILGLLLSNLLSGFNILNIILLTSFIIGLKLLIK